MTVHEPLLATPGRARPAELSAVEVLTAVPARAGDLRWFFGLTFVLTWGIAALVLVAPTQVEALTGELGPGNPLHLLAGYAPSLTAVALTAVRTGRPGLRELGSRLLRRGVSPGWFALVLLAWPFADLLARLLDEIVTERPLAPLVLAGTPPTPLHLWYLAPALLVVTLLLDAGPLGEEVGWRGYALPRLLHGRLGRLGAAVVLGLVSAAWHLPRFLAGGLHRHDAATGVCWLVLGAVLSSVVITWLYLRTDGSILVAGVLVHLMNDAVVASAWAFDLVMVLPALVAAIALLRRDHRDRQERRHRSGS